VLIPGAIKTKKSQCAESQRNKNVSASAMRPSAAGLFRWQVRQSGTHYRTVPEIQS